jgi:hypothetical protein
MDGGKADGVRHDLAGLLIHLPVCFVGVLLIDAVLFAAVYAMSSLVHVRMPNWGTAYNPIFWVPAVVTGFLVNRRLGNRSASLVGAIGATALFAVMWWDVSIFRGSAHYASLTGGHYWRYEFQQLLAPNDTNCGTSECLGKLLGTAPAVASVAYSIGAWFGLERMRFVASLQERRRDSAAASGSLS